MAAQKVKEFLTDAEMMAAQAQPSKPEEFISDAKMAAIERVPTVGPSPDPRSAGQVAFDQTMNVGRGFKNLVTGIPSAVAATAGAVKQAVTGGGTSQGQELVKGAVQGVVDPLRTISKGAAVLGNQNTSYAGSVTAPTDEEWVAAAQASGVNLAGLLVPGALGKVRVKALRSLDPSNLMVSAANTRAAGPAIASATDTAANVAGMASPRVAFGMKAAGRGASTVAQPFLNMLAKVQEGAAKWLSKGDVGPQIQGKPALVEGRVATTGPGPQVAVGRDAVRGRPAEPGGLTRPRGEMENRPPMQAAEEALPVEAQAPPQPYRPPFEPQVPQAPWAERQAMAAAEEQSRLAQLQGYPDRAPFAADATSPTRYEPSVSQQQIPTVESGLFTAPQVNRWMNVQPKQMVHGANPAKQILDDGLLDPTNKGATLVNAQAALKDVGSQMQSVLQEAGKRGVRLNMEDLVQDALDSANKTIGKRSDPAFQKVLGNVLDDIYAKQPDLANMTPAQAHALKVDIGDGVTWGKGSAFEADLNQALVEIYGKVNDAIKTSVPGIGPLQSRWGNLYQGVKSLKNSILRDEAGRGTGTVLQTPAQKMAADAAKRRKSGR